MEVDETALGQRKYQRGKRQRQGGPVNQTAVEVEKGQTSNANRTGMSIIGPVCPL